MPTYAEQAHTAHRAHQVAIQKARSFSDPDLSQEAIHTKRAALVQAEEDRYAEARNTIQSDAERSHTIRSQAAGEARPKITDHAQVAARWAQMKSLLDAGRTVRQVLAKADVAGVQAIQDYGPSYLEAKGIAPGLGHAGTTLPDVGRLCDDRYIALGSDAAQFITSERDSRADMEKALVYTQASTADSDLALAVKAQYTGTDPADDE